MVLIRVPSGVVNAVLFLVFDILILWAISQQLVVVQACYLYFLALRGHKIPIARSRVPIFSGKQMRGLTRWPSVFVLVNVAVCAIAFAATYQVNGETRPRFIKIKRSYVTSLTAGRRLGPVLRHGDARALDFTRKLGSESLVCLQRNETSVAYWPVAFNLGRNRTVPVDMKCQRGTDTIHPSGWQPLLKAHCMRLRGEDCKMNQLSEKTEVKLNATVQREWSRKRGKHKENRIMYRLRVLSSNYGEFSGKQGIVFIFPWMEYNNDSTGWRMAVFFLDGSSSDYSIMSYGSANVQSQSGMGEFTLVSPVRLFPAELASNSSNVVRALRYRFRVETIRSVGLTSSQLLEKFVQAGFASHALSVNRTAYNMVFQDVTHVPTSAIVLFGVLIGTLISLWVLTSFLHFFIVRKGAVPRSNLRLNDFDELSKRYRHDLESRCGVQPSNEYTVIAARTEQSGEVRLRPIVFGTESASDMSKYYS